MLKMVQDGLQKTKREADIWHGIGEICSQILAIVTLTHRPLHLLELGALTGIESYTAEELSKLVHL